MLPRDADFREAFDKYSRERGAIGYAIP